MISLSGVTKKFKNKTAVEKISFKAKPGEIIGFVGPNGAGKTTTMRLILGYLTSTQGKVEISGDIGYLAENNPQYADMRVLEYLQFIAEIKKVTDFSEIVEQVGLKDVMTEKNENLSRGYKQRVGLAAALIGNPEILILDEPTSGLDPLEQEKIRTLIKKLARKKTIIFSTHILSEVEDVATRLIIINNGKIVYEGTKPKSKGSVEKLFKKLVKN